MSFVSNLVGFTKKSQFSKLGRSDTYNMFVEQKDANEQGFSVVLLPMPGYVNAVTAGSVPAGKPQGTFRCSRGRDGRPCVYGVWGRKLYLVMEYGGGGVQTFFIGDIAGSGKVSFCETTGYGHASPHLVLCDGVNVYAVNTTLAPIEQGMDLKTVTMPLEYPDATIDRITPSWVAYMYGYLLVGAKGTDMFYRSIQFPFETSDDPMGLDKNPYGNWTFSEWQPDNTLVGCSTGSRLFTFGERSFQAFTFQDSMENPFVSPDTAAMSIGIKNADTLAVYGDSVIWLGSSSMGDGCVYMMDSSLQPKRISTDEIERMIWKYDFKTAYAFVYKWFSHPMYVISFPSDGVTLCYDIRENGWVRMGSRNDKEEDTFRYSYPVTGLNGDLFLQGEGCLVKATEDTWFEHDGTPILRKRAGGVISSDNRPFKIGSIKLITNNGDYRNVLDHAPLITLRYSKDGTTWVASSTRTLGYAGRYDYDTVFRNLGKAQYLAVEVGTSENVGFALYGLDVKGVTCAK